MALLDENRLKKIVYRSNLHPDEVVENYSSSTTSALAFSLFSSQKPNFLHSYPDEGAAILMYSRAQALRVLAGLNLKTWTLAVAMVMTLLVSPAVPGYDLSMVNTSEHALSKHPVRVAMAKLPAPFRSDSLQAVDARGQPLPTQVDDLTGDGKPDEVVFLVDMKPMQARTVQLRRGRTSRASTNLAVRDDGVLVNEYLQWNTRAQKLVTREDESVLENMSVSRPGTHTGQPRRLEGPVRVVHADVFQNDTFRIHRWLMLYGGTRGSEYVFRVENRTDAEQQLNMQANGHIGSHIIPDGTPEVEVVTPTGMALHSDPRVSERPHQLWFNRQNDRALGWICHQPAGWARWISRGGGSPGQAGSRIKISKFWGSSQDPWHQKRDFSSLPEPVILEPGEMRRFGMSFRYYEGPAAQTLKQYHADAVKAMGSVNVYGNGEVLTVAPGPGFLKEDFTEPGRWLTGENAELSVRTSNRAGGAVLRTRGDGGTIAFPITRNFSVLTELRGQIGSISDNAKMQVHLKDLDTGQQRTLVETTDDFNVSVSEQLPWRGVRRVLVQLELMPRDGAQTNGTGTLEATLEQLRLAWPLPAKPTLFAPTEGAELSNLAISFGVETHTVETADGAYQVQVSTDPDFGSLHETLRMDPVVWHMWKKNASRKSLYPDKAYPAGRYYARARGISVAGDPGPWSEVKQFRVVGEAQNKRKPLVKKVHPDEPLFIIGDANKVSTSRNIWKSLPSELRPYFAFQIGGERLPGDPDEWELDQVQYLPRMHQFVDVAQLEALYKKDKTIIGTLFGEMGFDGESMYRATRLAGNHGRLSGFLGGFVTQMLRLTTEEATKQFKDYAPYIMPVAKSNNPKRPLAKYIIATSLYATGRVDQWCAETEFGNAYKTLDWPWQRNWKPRVVTRPIDWMQPFIFGLAGGASAYYVQTSVGGITPSGNGRIRNFDGQGNKGSMWHRAMGPFFTDLVKYDMIPTRQQVRNKMRVALEAKPEYAYHSPHKSTTRFPNRIVGALHGIDVTNQSLSNIFQMQWMADSSRYYIVPMLPIHATQAERALFQDVVDPDEFESAQAAMDYFDQRYPAPPKGNEAFSVLVGDTGVITNTQDERSEARPQQYYLNLTRGPVEQVRGKVEYRQYLLTKQMDDQLFIHANNYMVKYTDVELMVSDPDAINIEVKPEVALIDKQWNRQQGVVSLRLGHNTGVARVLVKDSGQ